LYPIKVRTAEPIEPRIFCGKVNNQKFCPEKMLILLDFIVTILLDFIVTILLDFIVTIKS